MNLITWLRIFELKTRPIHPESKRALDRRWQELPLRLRTPSQTLGKYAVGCEGTHGVFPQCNFACTPCYHSKDANRVAIDGHHTILEVEKQMALLRTLRGPVGHAQLIGGEVSLLAPDDHAETLLTMRKYGREPMGFTHGDFDYDYLRSIVLDVSGQVRISRISFAAHFDTTMVGRGGIKKPESEPALDPYRSRFADMFKRLKHEFGVNSFLAHNMTVTPHNVDQIANVIRECKHYGFGLFSFQPAAFVGNEQRWKENYRQTTGDAVWEQIEQGAGTRLPFRAFQHGDERCNRTTYGFFCDDRYFPVIDDLDPIDLRHRDAFFRYLSGVSFTGSRRAHLAAKLIRISLRHPGAPIIAGHWLARTIRKVGIRQLLANGIRPVTFVMHSFMDASDVKQAWLAIQSGETCTEPRLVETQERLLGCSYAMAHPETGELVPACVQHSVLDPEENVELRKLLPITHLANPRRKTKNGAGENA